MNPKHDVFPKPYQVFFLPKSNQTVIARQRSSIYFAVTLQRPCCFGIDDNSRFLETQTTFSIV